MQINTICHLYITQNIDMVLHIFKSDVKNIYTVLYILFALTHNKPVHISISLFSYFCQPHWPASQRLSPIPKTVVTLNIENLI